MAYLNISDEFYKVSSRAQYDTNNLNVIVEDSNNQIPAEIKTAPNGNSIDIIKSDLPGFDFVKFTVTGTPAVNDRFTVFESRESVYSIKFLRHIPNESWNMSINIDGAVINIPVINIGNNVGEPSDKYPSFKTVMDEQFIMFKNHPNTIFINAHMGWMANDLDKLEDHLDKLPNVYTEIGAVIGELGRQPRRARFIQW